MPIQLEVKGHLLIPFGRPKWDINKIRIAGVSTTGTYIESDTPVVYINRNEKRPLRLDSVNDVFPEHLSETDDPGDALDAINAHLKKTCKLDTEFEKRFLDLYFKYCRESVTPSDYQLRNYREDELPAPVNNFLWVFQALLPLPQAHLYLENPLDEGYTFIPANMVRVDFVFWTGQNLVAVEIDGQSHVGSEAHIRKDRMLMRAGVEVIHILNEELLKHGTRVIRKLLPTDVVKYWGEGKGPFFFNPLGDMPF